MNIDEKIVELGNKVKNKEMTWRQVADAIFHEFGEVVSANAVRKRYNVRIRKVPESELNMNTKVDSSGEYETLYNDGALEAQKIVEYNKEAFGDKKKMLEYLGYSPNEWEFVFLTTSIWQQHTKEQTTKQLYAVKFKLKPLINNLSLEKAVEVAKEVFSKSITPYEFETIEHKDLNEDRLLLIPQIEAHLGKFSEEIETGVTYNYSIVEQRVKKVFESVIELQIKEKCNSCLLVVGGDFFNSESNNQTTGGTLQENDVNYKKMFNIGLNLYLSGIITLKEYFNEINVKICAGNHARAMEHFLYIALSCYFAKDEKVHFCEDYKNTQSFVFGKVGLFFNHGDPNQKRLINSIPAEFYEEYGKTQFRYLFLGHLHKLEVINSENGITVHRVPAICENDKWHYQNRFGIGNIPQHELMVFDKNVGMLNDTFIYFNEALKVKKKKLVK